MELYNILLQYCIIDTSYLFQLYGYTELGKLRAAGAADW